MEVTPERTRWIHAPALTLPTEGRALQSGDDLCPGIRLFTGSPATTVQAAPAPDGITLNFSGRTAGFASLAIDVPAERVRSLAAHLLVRVEGQLVSAEPATGFVRLNIRAASEPDRVNRPLRPRSDGALAEFDLHYWPRDPAGSASAWIDLILEPPLPARVQLRGLRVLGRARAFV